MSFGKMATLLFGLAGMLALGSFTVLPAAPSFVTGGGGGGGSGHVVTTHVEGEDSAESASRRFAEARERHPTPPLDFGATPGDMVGAGDPGASPTLDRSASDETSPSQDRAPQQAAAPRAPQVQAAPQVSFVPGQPMIDTNPSR